MKSGTQEFASGAGEKGMRKVPVEFTREANFDISFNRIQYYFVGFLFVFFTVTMYVKNKTYK